MNDQERANQIIPAIGGKENVVSLTHCMTRLRFVLKDESKADGEVVKAIDGVMGVTQKGGQYQLIIGPTVANLYEAVNQQLGELDQEPVAKQEDAPASEKEQQGRGKAIFENILNYISGSLTPLIPILLVASFCKTIAVVIGPTLLKLVSESSDIY